VESQALTPCRPADRKLASLGRPPIRILHVEDNELDAELVSLMLRQGGIEHTMFRVETEEAFSAALADGDFDLILSDHTLPSFSGIAALTMGRRRRPDLPFIFVSGTIGEERAIEALTQGATDYVLKQRLNRLVPAIQRALEERHAQRARARAEREEREAQRRLRSSEAQFRAVAETIPCALFIHQGARRVYVNRWAEQVTGYTRDELLARDFWGFVHPDYREEVRERILARQRGEDVPTLYEVKLLTKAGEERWALVSSSLVEFEGKPAALGTATDVTDHKRAEAELRRQAAALAQTEKLAAMGSLLAGVAHELNNPLGVIAGQTELLRRSLEGEPAGRAAKIATAADRCARIVRNFLALARQRPTERGWASLKQVVEEALELVAYSLTSAGIEVVTDHAAELPRLWADPHQLHQVVVNLITNAQHALLRRPSPRRLVLTLGRRDADRVFLEIADNGPGIPAAVVARVFEPFFTTKSPGEGTGLGLSLCRGIIESHGGTINLESTPGEGTLLRIELPVGRGAGAAAPAVAEPATGGVIPARVLVVEDEVELADVVAELLSARGHQVDVARNGREALEKLVGQAYHVILSDLRMPEMDGPTLYAEVQRRFPGLERRFVFVTGDTFAGRTTDFLERTGCPSLAKPFTLEDVERVVNEVRRASGWPALPESVPRPEVVRQCRLLVIQDDAALRSATVALLREEGYQVDAAADGAAGLALARERRFDLVICEIVTNGLDGYAVVTALREDPFSATIPFIFLTGVGEPAALRQGMERGADDYLTQPVAAERLLRTVAARLNRTVALRRESLRRLDALRAGLARAMPHEFLTPLTAVMGLSSMLMEEGVVPAADAREVARGIFVGGAALQRAIAKLIAPLERTTL